MHRRRFWYTLCPRIEFQASLLDSSTWEARTLCSSCLSVEGGAFKTKKAVKNELARGPQPRPPLPAACVGSPGERNIEAPVPVHPLPASRVLGFTIRSAQQTRTLCSSCSSVEEARQKTVKKQACGKTTANTSASCNLPRSSGRSNCKRRSRGAFVEYILFTAEYVLGS